MKEIKVIILLLIYSVPVCAQDKESDFWNNFKRIYPWHGFTIKAGVGVYPYGMNSISKGSERYLGDRNPLYSEYFEVSYTPKKLPIGFFISFSLNQFHKSNDWSPFDWYSSLPDYKDDRIKIGRLEYIESKSNSFNTGVLFGKEVVEGLEIYAKLGVGNSWHNYRVTYSEEFNINNRFGGNFKTQSLNYQAAIDFSFFPIPIVGFSGSFGISDNFPVFTLSSAWKFGYKTANPKKDN